MTYRVRLSRKRGARLPAAAVSVAYPTKWANPFRPVTRSPAANDEAVRQYCRYLQQRPDLVAAARAELAGRNLACWCSPELVCHADVLLQIARGVRLDQVRLGVAA
jgi:hypothetical protein